MAQREKEEEEKKRGALPIDLLSNPEVVSYRGLGGSIFNSGILATKAGIVALIVTGTTIAGGLGVVGIKLFGDPSSTPSDAGFEDSFNSPFAAKPKEAASEEAGQNASADGSSASLQYLADANKGGAAGEKKDEAQPAAASEALKDAVASPAATVLPAAVAQAAANPGAGAPPARPGINMKLGELSKGIGGNKSGATYSPGSYTASDPTAGKLSKMRGNVTTSVGSASSLSSGHAIAVPSRLGKSYRALGSVLRDQRSGSSSAAAGRTYDNGPAQSSTLGATQSAGTIEGVGSGAKGKAAAAQSLNPTTNPASFNEPPAVSGQNVTPWQGALDTAKYLLMGALALMFIGKMCIEKALAARAATPYSEPAVTAWKLAAQVALGLAAAAGLAAMAIGINIATGPNNQPLQGWALALGGGFASAAALVVLKDVWNMDCGATAAETKLGPLLGGHEVLMYACGGAALVGLAVTFLTTPRTIPADGKNHDWGVVAPARTDLPV